MEYPPLLPPETELSDVRVRGKEKGVTLGVAGTRPTCVTVTRGV
jgi:hypothetical protein